VTVLGQRHFFTERLARQQRGSGVLLLAWLDGRPVGDVFLATEPADEPEVRRHLPGVPRLIHLEVLGSYQRRGIGTALIRAGEDTARWLGHEWSATCSSSVSDPSATSVLHSGGSAGVAERQGARHWGASQPSMT
jgi:GNAT superfamily N-acetyltransferase